MPRLTNSQLIEIGATIMETAQKIQKKSGGKTKWITCVKLAGKLHRQKAKSKKRSR
jgi:hypothetical protein